MLQLRLTWHKRIPKPLLESLCHSKSHTEVEKPIELDFKDPDDYKPLYDGVNFKNEFARLEDLIKFAMTGF